LKIKKLPMSELINAEYNPRKDLQESDPEYQKIKKSIDEFGYIEPIIVNENCENNKYRIVGGHQRVKVLNDLGYTDIDCVIVGLDETKEKALNVALNKISGEWDNQKLYEVLKDFGEDDFLLTGFDNHEFKDLEKEFNKDKNQNNFDNIDNDNFNIEKAKEEAEKKTITKNGYLYQLGNHYLFCGDCTNEVNIKILFKNLKVDCLITDPPYGVDYSNKNEFLNKFNKGNRIQKEIKNDAIKDYRKFFSDFLKVIPFNGYNTCYIAMLGQELHNLRLAFDDCDIKWSDYLVWVKNNHALGRKDYNAKHEFFVYGWKDKHKFYGNFSTTILEYNRSSKNDLHPTMKPIELLARLIMDGSKQEAIIYDPFGGSGSTMIACEQLNRFCYMIEIEPIYCDVIINRYIKFKENANDVFLIDNNKKIPWNKIVKV